MSYRGKKEAVIVAGANGSGKTTFAHRFLDVTKYEFLNADEIAKELSPEDPSKARVAAGRKLLRKIDEHIKEEKNFVIESTLSGSFLEKHIEKLRGNGYTIDLFFVFLGSPDLCIERIKTRVALGGHDVLEVDIRRRYTRGIKRFWQEYKYLCDHVYIFYNGGKEGFKRVASGEKDITQIEDQMIMENFLGEINEG